ncbi:MAG: choice-of-anchor I family protein [Pseudomonadota bacterium]
MHPKRSILAAAALLGLAGAAQATPLNWARSWTYDHASTGVAGQTSEIVSFEALSNTLWVVGLKGVDVLNASTGSLVQHIDTSAFGEANSVAIHNGLVAVAVAAPTKTDAGSVRFYDASRTYLGSTTVGALPDMLTFTPDGSRLLVANEGERSASVDPSGSVSIIDVASRSVLATAGLVGVPTAGSHIRSFTGALGGTAMDAEPESITVNAAGTKAFVVLQEANAIATLDLASNRFTRITGLGVKSFNSAASAIDPTDRDYLTGSSGPTQLALRPVAASGLYQPDGIASYSVGGQTFLVMANEGDARADEQDEARASTFGATGELARLTVSRLDSSAGNLVAYGARSFSIRDEDGNIVFDSGNQLDQLAIDNGLYDDSRSDNKGVEPEGVTLASIAGRTYAFIGLERTTTSAVAVYDISNPAQASFVDLIIGMGDVSPEGLTSFQIGGQTYLAVANEVSGSTSVYSLTPVPEPATYALMLGGLAGVLALSRRRRAVR